VPLEQPQLIHIQVNSKQLPLICGGLAVPVDDLAQLAFAELQVLGNLVLSNTQLKYLQFEVRIHVHSTLTLRGDSYRDRDRSIVMTTIGTTAFGQFWSNSNHTELCGAGAPAHSRAPPAISYPGGATQG